MVKKITKDEWVLERPAKSSRLEQPGAQTKHPISASRDRPRDTIKYSRAGGLGDQHLWMA
jgi:hypothetical protein